MGSNAWENRSGHKTRRPYLGGKMTEHRDKLIDIFTGNVPPTVKGYLYDWQRIYSSAEMVEYGRVRTVKNELRVVEGTKHEERFLYMLEGTDYIDEIHDGVEFTDGTALVLAQIKEFAGTDEDMDTTLRYFILTPKND